MSELSNGLGGDAPRHTIKACGKVYTIGLVTQGIKVAYEKALFQKARESVAAMKGDLDTADYLGLMSKLAAEYAQGEFAMEGQRGQEFLKKPRGSFLLLSLLMGIDEHEAMQVLVDDGADAMTVLRAVLKESFPGVKDELLGDSPAPKAAG